MSESLPESVHASAVLIGEAGVLIRGASGSGKSSLLLDVLDTNPAASRLVADDRVVLTVAHGRLLASPPAALAGLIEIRGHGVVRRPHVAPVVIRLVADLAADAARLPDEQDGRTIVAGVDLPRIGLRPGPANATRLRAVLADFGHPVPARPSHFGS